MPIWYQNNGTSVEVELHVALLKLIFSTNWLIFFIPVGVSTPIFVLAYKSLPLHMGELVGWLGCLYSQVH